MLLCAARAGFYDPGHPGNSNAIASVKDNMTRASQSPNPVFATVFVAAAAMAVAGCGSQPVAQETVDVLATPPNTQVVTLPSVTEVDDEPPPTANVVVTVQPLEERALAEGDYETVAEIRGVSVEEVEAMVGVQGRLSSFADRAIADLAVIGFRFTPGATGGELLVEPGFDVNAAFPDLDRYPEIEVIESRLTIEQRSVAETAITESLRAFVDSDTEVGPPVFDGFETSYTIYLMTHDGLDIAEIQSELRSAAIEATGVDELSIDIAEPADSEFAERDALGD